MATPPKAPSPTVTGKTLDDLLAATLEKAAAHDEAEANARAAKEAYVEAAAAYEKAANAYEKAKKQHGGAIAARALTKSIGARAAAEASDDE